MIFSNFIISFNFPGSRYEMGCERGSNNRSHDHRYSATRDSQLSECFHWSIFCGRYFNFYTLDLMMDTLDKKEQKFEFILNQTTS